MSLSFTSSDFGALVFGREVLKRSPKASLAFVVQKQGEVASEENFWLPGMQVILAGKTRFGRVGFVFDRQNAAAQAFATDIEKQPFDYQPLDRRAEKTPRITSFPTQLLHHMANEGFADSVEFRRLARKVLRRAKHAHIDTLFFAEAIFGEEKTKTILQRLAGTQMKVFVPSDFLEEKDIKAPGKARDISIISTDDKDFVHHRAQEILRTKLSLDSVRVG